MEQLARGTVARSRAGRDQGRFFAVLSVEGDFCTVADGDVRTLAHPKRKRQKHLAPTAQRVELENVAGDRQLRRLLQPWNRDPQESECGRGGVGLVEK